MARAPEPSPDALPLSARMRLIGVLVLIAVIYAPMLRYGLIYDDGWTLRSNGFLQPGSFELGLLFSPEAAARHIPDAFRPTLVIFDHLSLRLFELDGRAHHGISIALHLGVCALLARLLARLGVAELPRLLALACFGLLAIHVEAVAVISYREDLLAAALGLAAVLAALRSVDTGAAQSPKDHARRWPRALAWGLAAAALEALACGAKLSAAPLPGMLVLLAWLAPNATCREWASSRARVAQAVGWLALGVALALAQRWIAYGGSPYGVANPRVLAARLGLGPVLAQSAQIHLGYLQQILVPLGLSPEYVDRGASWLDPATVASVAILLALGIAAVVGRRRWPLASFAFLAWLLACLPTSNLVGLPNMRADRFMYLASAPVCVALAFGLLALGRRVASFMGPHDVNSSSAGDPNWVWLPALAFVLMQGSFLVAESRVYVSNTTLWHEAARRAPDSARAHALLGLERVALARRSERLSPELMLAGEDSCMLAAQLDPAYELPQLCLGSLASAREDWPLAYEHHVLAVELSIDRNDRPIASLAQISLDLPSQWFVHHPEFGDRRQLSRSWLERGLRAYPYSPELHAAAAHIYHRLGDADLALEMYRRARALRPDRWETVAGGVELALDLGDAAAAYRTWWAEAELLGRADPATRTRLRRRLAAARRDPDFSLFHSLLSPGVFPNEP